MKYADMLKQVIRLIKSYRYPNIIYNRNNI